VQFLDSAGQPIDGFTFADCEPITGDALDAPLQCAEELSAIAGEPVRIELALSNSRLYGLALY
jgi:hypothetical protein